jgi:hypothetical protein
MLFTPRSARSDITDNNNAHAGSGGGHPSLHSHPFHQHHHHHDDLSLHQHHMQLSSSFCVVSSGASTPAAGAFGSPSRGSSSAKPGHHQLYKAPASSRHYHYHHPFDLVTEGANDALLRRLCGVQPLVESSNATPWDSPRNEEEEEAETTMLPGGAGEGEERTHHASSGGKMSRRSGGDRYNLFTTLGSWVASLPAVKQASSAAQLGWRRAASTLDAALCLRGRRRSPRQVRDGGNDTRQKSMTSADDDKTKPLTFLDALARHEGDVVGAMVLLVVDRIVLGACTWFNGGQPSSSSSCGITERKRNYHHFQ